MADMDVHDLGNDRRSGAPSHLYDLLPGQGFPRIDQENPENVELSQGEEDRLSRAPHLVEGRRHLDLAGKDMVLFFGYGGFSSKDGAGSRQELPFVERFGKIILRPRLQPL